MIWYRVEIILWGGGKKSQKIVGSERKLRHQRAGNARQPQLSFFLRKFL